MASYEASDMVGTGEIAQMANVAKNVVVNWANRYSSFPKPIVTLIGGRIWSKTEIVKWLEESTETVVVRVPKRKG